MPDGTRPLAKATSAAVAVLRVTLVLFAVGVLGWAGFDAVTDRVAGAVTLMAIFLVSLIALALPRLESFKAFGVEARLAAQIRNAEITLQQFEKLARSSARLGFQWMMAGAGRWAPFEEKHATVAALNDSMQAAGLDETEAAELRQPFLIGLAIDLLYPVQTVAVHLKCKRIREIENELRGHEVAIPGAADPEHARWAALRDEKRQLAELSIPSAGQPTRPETLDAALDSCAGPFPRSDDEDRRLHAIIASAKRIMAECHELRNVTPDSEAFLAFRHQVHPGFFGRDDSIERAEGLLRSRFAQP